MHTHRDALAKTGSNIGERQLGVMLNQLRNQNEWKKLNLKEKITLDGNEKSAEITG